MTEGWAKRFVFGTLDALGVTSLAAAIGSGVPILAYHGVSSRTDHRIHNRRRLHVSAEVFERHLQLLTREWHPTSLQEFVTGLKERRPPAPRTAVVTFDDRYRNLRTVAAPLLRRFEIPFTLFVVTEHAGGRLWTDRLEAAIETTNCDRISWRGFALALGSVDDKARAAEVLARHLQPLGCERADVLAELLEQLQGDPDAPDEDRDLLTWKEIRELRDAGAEIGGHSDVHEPLTRRLPQAVETAVGNCLETLAERLGRSPYAFCYPFGAWNAATAAAVQTVGFTAALTTDSGRNDPDADVYALRRCLVGADDNVARLRASLSGIRALPRRRQGR